MRRLFLTLGLAILMVPPAEFEGAMPLLRGAVNAGVAAILY
jgi:hypothetical protein